MWLRALGVLLAVLLTAGMGYVVFQAPTEVAQAPPPPAPTDAMTPVTTTPPPTPAPPTATPSPLATTAPPEAPSPPAQATGDAEQRAADRLRRLMNRARIPGDVALSVLDGEGQEIFGHNATTTVLPASTQKLAVAAAALVQLGPDHRYTTTVRATAAPNARGVVQGDLVVVGGADPALAGPAFGRIEPERPRTPLEDLAGRVKRAGVRRVTGRIVADPTILAHEPVAVGWPARYFDSLDATRISGLTVDGGRRVYRTSSGYYRSTAAEDPARQTIASLRSLLRDRGVKVGKRLKVVREPHPATVEVASIKSPPLGDILRYMVQRSDNHLADTVFRSVGAAAGSATWVGAAGATANALGPLQLDWTDAVLADGSGLSRVNKVSPLFLAQLQSRLWRSNLNRHWTELLAVSGVRGTLRNRLRGTVAERRLYGKTGSLRDVSALVGTVVGSNGRTAHFSIVGNRLSSTAAVRALTDKVVLVMAEELQDCRRVERPRKRKNAKPRPPKLVCA